MGWIPYWRFKVASTAGDRHWWVKTDAGHKVHQYIGVQVLEDGDIGNKLFQVIIGPFSIILAGKYA